MLDPGIVFHRQREPISMERERSLRLPIFSAAVAASVLMPVAVGYARASAQDFSITNPEAPAPAFPGRRDLMRQLQAWWDVHAYYPRHASSNDESGTVKLHLEILPDGRIWAVRIVAGSGSRSLDAAAVAVFQGGFVTRAPEGTPQANPDLSVHYVLSRRHDGTEAPGYTLVSSRQPFSITNDPVKSPILETMLQRTCTGKVVKQGIRNYPIYGVPYYAQAIFFRKPDGTPWVKFYEGGYPTLAPVVEVGKLVQWTGREEHIKSGLSTFTQSTVWPDGENTLSGNLEIKFTAEAKSITDINRGGTVDFTCANDIVPTITWNALSVTPGQDPPGDPP